MCEIVVSFEIRDESSDLLGEFDDCNDWMDAIVEYIKSCNVDPDDFLIEAKLPHESWNYQVVKEKYRYDDIDNEVKELVDSHTTLVNVVRKT